MALFSNKPAPKKEAPARVKTETVASRELSRVLTAPWFSEKALIGTEKGVYVFSVPASATKTEVREAVKHTYNVTPRKVRMAHLPGKVKALRTKRGTGTRARRHKAYVYLKKGETIALA